MVDIVIFVMDTRVGVFNSGIQNMTHVINILLFTSQR